MLVAEADTVVGAEVYGRAPVHLLATCRFELRAETSLHYHAVPRAKRRPEFLVEMGGKAVTRPAQNLLRACVTDETFVGREIVSGAPMRASDIWRGDGGYGGIGTTGLRWGFGMQLLWCVAAIVCDAENRK